MKGQRKDTLLERNEKWPEETCDDSRMWKLIDLS